MIYNKETKKKMIPAQSSLLKAVLAVHQLQVSSCSFFTKVSSDIDFYCFIVFSHHFINIHDAFGYNAY